MTDTEKPQGDTPALESDIDLVKKAKNEDRAAYNELIKRYHRKIYALVYNMTSNKEDAEDLTQDIFFKAYTSLKQFQGQSSFYTWIYRIGVNRTINFIKKRNRRNDMSLDNVDNGIERDPVYVELSARESPFRDANLSELQEKLNKALMKLSEKHRMVVVLHDIQGVPHDEIAKTLGCSQGTVRSRLFYARQQLQAELSEFIK